MSIKKGFIFLSLAIFLISMVGILSSCKAKKEKTAEQVPPLVKAPDIQQHLAKFSPTEITLDEHILSAEDRALLNKFIGAAQLIDRIFWNQAYPPGTAIKEQLEKSTLPEDKDYLRFLNINFGPFDRQDENKPFIGTAQKPAGAGFYPADLTKQEFEDYLAKNPGEKEQLESPFTVVKRQDGKLVAVPYPAEYKGEVDEIAQAL